MNNNGKRYAVIVGISSYGDARQKNLRFTTNDAEGMYCVLLEAVGFAAENISLFCDDPSDKYRAIAIAQPEDKNRFGSHRFITCLPDPSKALVEYLRTWFLSAEGMAEIRAASPGAAGRNKTLNLKKLEAIQVPVPDMAKQRRFADVYARVQPARKLNQQTADELETIMPAILERTFSGTI